MRFQQSSIGVSHSKMAVFPSIVHASSIIAQSTFGTIAFSTRRRSRRSLLKFRIVKQGRVPSRQLTALRSSMYIPPVRYVSVSVHVDPGSHCCG